MAEFQKGQSVFSYRSWVFLRVFALWYQDVQNAPVKVVLVL